MLAISRAVSASVLGTACTVSVTFVKDIAPERMRPKVIAVIFAGFSVALVLGVPLGTFVAQICGWNAAFWLISAMLVATVLMGIVLNLYIHNTGTVPAADNAAPLTDGNYPSSAQGCLSEVTVTVTVTGGKVTAVQVDASAETPELGGKAAETLAAQLIQTGSTAGVDAITGATLTSEAIFTAMDACLAQAQ